MRVFISWSGSLSNDIAEEFRDWLPTTLQFVKPYFSPADIDKGARWVEELFKVLSETKVCIIILTRESLNSNWILFEAGAIAAKLDTARVCPIVFDIAATDLVGPLALFQATRFSKDDIRRLMATINTAAGESGLEQNILDKVFEKNWEDLDASVQLAYANQPTLRAVTEVRSQRDLLEEILLIVRRQQQPLEGRSQVEVINYQTQVILPLLRIAQTLLESGQFDTTTLAKLKTDLEHVLYRTKLIESLGPKNMDPVFYLETILESLRGVDDDEWIPE